MTRGTPYLILRSEVVRSDEFNGDMYGSPEDSKSEQQTGYYPEMMKRLRKVKSEKEFRREIRAFSKDYHNHHPLSFYTDARGEIDLSDDYFINFFSDYLFFKNLSERPVRIIDSKKHPIELGHGLIATFHFGEFIEMI